MSIVPVTSTASCVDVSIASTACRGYRRLHRLCDHIDASILCWAIPTSIAPTASGVECIDRIDYVDCTGPMQVGRSSTSILSTASASLLHKSGASVGPSWSHLCATSIRDMCGGYMHKSRTVIIAAIGCGYIGIHPFSHQRLTGSEVPSVDGRIGCVCSIDTSTVPTMLSSTHRLCRATSGDADGQRQ